MKIEVGKFYNDENGIKRGPMKDIDGFRARFHYDGSLGTFNIDGRSYAGADMDLIAEWTDTPEVGTLQEIGAQEGDTVEWKGKLYTVMSGTPYPAYYEPMTWASKEVPFVELGDWISSDADGVKIISRAQPKPQQTGPVRTVTRKEVVPGVYGKVEVGTWKGDHKFAAIGIHQDWHTCVGVSKGLAIMSADDLTAAIDTLTAIRDALKENGE